MRSRCLIVIPVHDEKGYLKGVLNRITESTDEDILAIDDGSTDGSSEILEGFEPERQGYELLRHPECKGYGSTLIRGFDYSIREGYEFVLTLDGDGQHWRLVFDSRSGDMMRAARVEQGSEPSHRPAAFFGRRTPQGYPEW